MLLQHRHRGAEKPPDGAQPEVRLGMVLAATAIPLAFAGGKKPAR